MTNRTSLIALGLLAVLAAPVYAGDGCCCCGDQPKSMGGDKGHCDSDKGSDKKFTDTKAEPKK